MGERKASQEMNHPMESEAQEHPIVLARRDRGEAGIDKSAFSRWHPTTVFESFWKFATERQAIFYRRLAARSSQWTTDHTLATFKFTNVYRASDRVSQFLIRRVIYAGDPSPREVFFRTILFKLFNKIETWELLRNHFGEINSTLPLSTIDSVLSKAMASGRRIYSAAYIMPSGTTELRMGRKHTTHLNLLAKMLQDGVPNRLTDCSCMSDAFTILRSYPMLGNFLAYQYVIDINYSEITNFSESEFVVPGPGARNGIRKCFARVSQTEEIDVIRAVAENQETEFRQRGLDFKYLADRRLQLIDCQNLFCEIDKYARVEHPEFNKETSRTRIKQKFCPNFDAVDYWYPPKWGINESFLRGSKANNSFKTAAAGTLFNGDSPAQ
jgi:5-hmdU DNA kinase-like protein